MTITPARILALLLALPLILLLLCLFLPLLILMIILGIFSPALRGSYRSFSTRFPGSGTRQGTSSRSGESQSGEDVCDVECTVLHAETVDHGSSEENKTLR